MSKNQKNNAPTANVTIASNRKALHNYFVESRFEAGIVLEGWEIKSIRAGKVQLAEAYVILQRGEAWLLGAHISPLTSASTHIVADPTRTRKLLLHKRELSNLFGSVERKGITLIPLSMYWKRSRVKLEVGLAKGKKQHDKRASIKDREWQRDKQRLFKQSY
jgi:SsrA-binding protein